MQYWLHFVGQRYYTRASFTREARQYGVSRRVSLLDLRRMDWGDVVLLVIKEGKSAVLFGQFEIQTLTGLSAEARAVLEKWFGLRQVDPGGLTVQRGCGRYVTGPSYAIDASLPEIAEVLVGLKRAGVDIGRLMVGGAFRPHLPARLASIPHRQGFRLFDYEAFKATLGQTKATNGRRVPVVKGQFYVTSSARYVKGGTVQEVTDYRRREELSA